MVWIPTQAYYSTITFILKMHICKIFKKIINIFLEKARSRPSSRLYDIFQVEKGERETGTTVVWIPSQAY